MPGDQHGDELVAELAVGHRRAVLVSGREEEREDVGAGGAVGGAAARLDDAAELRVDGGAAPQETSVRAERKVALQRRHEGEDRRRRLHVLDEEVPEPVAAGALLDAEDGAQDDLERDRLHVRGCSENGAPTGQRSMVAFVISAMSWA